MSDDEEVPDDFDPQGKGVRSGKGPALLSKLLGRRGDDSDDRR